MNNIESLQKAALNHQVAPKDTAWVRLEAKLDKNRSVKKISKYKQIAIAAVMLGIAGVMSLFYTQKQLFDAIQYDNQVSNYTLNVLESEGMTEQGIYDTDQLRNLKIAYQQSLAKTKM